MPEQSLFTKIINGEIPAHRIYEDMVIESLKALQTEDTKYHSEFIVTLKEIRKADTITTVAKVGAPIYNQKASAPVQGNTLMSLKEPAATANSPSASSLFIQRWRPGGAFLK